ncbi:cytochrome c biogenesis protein CcsA [Longitalea arenae]|uniref:cytochrome c biogenesis protein CcsA n=1 Tax=Longitalea arenae TaxID=2812558 RepID=UPI00196738A5|nr:cytochrome c biogenesis protein CcsA [Longitalea arenae]
MRQYWWKILSIVLLIYTFIAGLLIPLPYETAYASSNLYESMRNFFFHVPMWFSQLALITVSLYYSIKYLRNPNPTYDIYATEFARTGTVLGVLGLITGAIWAQYTWGAAWSNDPKQIGAAIALLIYVAYFVLRNSMPDMDKRGRVAAVYNIFAYFIYIPMILILPRLTESLHPGGKGSEGNPGLGGSSLDATMRLVFWPGVLGWILLSTWISTLRLRVRLLEEKKHSA